MKSPQFSTKLKKPSRPPALLLLRRIRGDSMLPTLMSGQLVLFVAGRPVRVGDIVMFRQGGLEKIKRVARVDGSRVYLLGDNPSASTDSRSFGWLGLEAIQGTLLWPRTKVKLQ